MKLQLKRSNQVTGLPGSEIALPPTAANTEFGEISVNYNEYDPALFCKLDNGDIVRLGGANDDYLLTSTGTATTGQIVLTHDPVGTKAATTDSINITGGTGVTIDGSTSNTINISIDGGSDIGADLYYTAAANNGVINNTAGNDVTIPGAVGSVSAGLISAADQTKVDRVVDPGTGKTLDDRYVKSAGDSMTGNLELSNNSKIVFEGATADNFETTLTAVDPTADNTLSLPDVSGSLVSTGDTGTVTSTMIANLTIVNEDIGNSADISVSKLGEGSANQVLVTNATGDGVVWANDINLSGTITIAGIATFNGGISADGSFSVANDTGNVSTTGTLTVSQLATFNGGISADGAFSVSDATGHVSTTGNLDVSGLSSLDGGIDVDGAFTVSDTTGNVSTTGTLTVSDLATFNGGISADGAFSVANDSGNVSTTGSLTVSDLATFNGGISADGAFSVANDSGNVSTTGSLTVSDLATFNGGISADGAFSVANETGNVSTTGSLTVSDLATFNGGISADGAFSVANDSGNVSTTGTLTVSNLATFNGGISADGAFSVANDTGDVSTTGTLGVTGLISANGKLSFPLGSQTAPSLYPGTDVNTGIYSPAADTFAITTGGVERARFSSTGNFGINATNPLSLLQVGQARFEVTGLSAERIYTYPDVAGTVALTSSNVATASAWANARTITLGTDLSGSVSLDGSSNVTLNATVADDSHNHIIANVDGLQTALNGKLGSTANAVSASQWNTARTITLGGDTTGSVSLDGSSNVTLNITVTDDSHNHTISNVDSLQTTLDAKADLVGGVVPTSQIPALAITEFLGTVSSQSAMLALSGQKGDWCNRTDVSSTFIITGTDPTQIGSWTELDYPAADVTSVNSQTGAVVLGASDVGLGNVDNTSDLNKPISTATQTALNGKLGSTANAASASQWNTARTITLGTDLSGSVSIDGSANVTLNATVADDSHNHIIGNIDGLQAALNGKLGSTANAASASKWNTARTITLGTDLSGSVSLDGSSNVTLNATVADDSHNHIIANVDGLQTALNGKLGSTAKAADSELLDGQDGTYYLNTSTSFGGDVSGTYNNIVVANDSHTHDFNNLTGKSSGTGEYSTNGYLVAGRGSGGVALTVNDGYGNANVTFNHKNGTPETNGRAGRIEVNADDTSGDAFMYFELGNATANTAAGLTSILTLSNGTSEFTSSAGLTFNNRPAFNGGTSGNSSPFTVDSTQVVSNLNADLLDGQQGSYYQNASNLNAGTIPDARIPDTITPATLVSTKEVRTSNGNEIVLNAGESAGKIGGQTTEIVYVNAEQGLRVCTPSVSNWGTGYVEQRTNITGSGIFFHHNTTAMGEITTQDSTWLRINQNTNKNIFTPRYIRADGGFFVDGAVYGINGTGVMVSNTGATIGGNTAWHAGNDGAGSGLDADTLDGIQGVNYVRTNASNTISSRHRFNANETNNWDDIATATGSQGALEIYNTGVGNDAFMSFHCGGDYALYFGLDADSNELAVGGWSKGANKYKIWHAGNDGSGSGLDADLLDGAQPSVAASNSTIVQRHSSGYIYANYFNTTPNDVTSGVTRICCETGNDGFIRHATSDAVQGFIGTSVTGTANSMVKRDGSGDIYARLFRSTYQNQSTISGAIAYRVSTTDNYIRFCSDAGAVRTFLGAAPSASPTFSGNLTIPDAIVHAGDTDTYIQFNAADTFRVVCSGAEVQKWGNNYTILGDSDTLRLGTGSDYRMWHDGTNTIFRNYNHTNGNTYHQGENTSGTNQTTILEMYNAARTYVRLYENNAERLRTTSGGISVTGALTATGNVTAFSDIKLKEDIKVIPNALEKVSKIRGVTFIRNDVDDKSRQAGVIAQEVEKVLPEVVTTTEDGIKTVAYGNLVGLLIESIKELKKELEELKGASN